MELGRGNSGAYPFTRIPRLDRPYARYSRVALRATVMNWKEFNSIMIRHEYPGFVELDLLRFGSRQSETVDFWLVAAKQADPFGERIVLKN
jgi:hypothetical protein